MPALVQVVESIEAIGIYQEDIIEIYHKERNRANPQ